MLFPDYRPRRMRLSKAFRRMVRETELSVNDLILPLFAVAGKGVKNPIDSMPGCSRCSSGRKPKSYLIKPRKRKEKNLSRKLLTY